jgi:hypothetical protein
LAAKKAALLAGQFTDYPGSRSVIPPRKSQFKEAEMVDGAQSKLAQSKASKIMAVRLQYSTRSDCRNHLFKTSRYRYEPLSTRVAPAVCGEVVSVSQLKAIYDS